MFVVCSVQIFGEEDETGFFQGELNGRQGFVPSNMVEEVGCKSEEKKQEIMRQIRLPKISSVAITQEDSDSLLDAIGDSSSMLSSSEEDEKEEGRREVEWSVSKAGDNSEGTAVYYHFPSVSVVTVGVRKSERNVCI